MSVSLFSGILGFATSTEIPINVAGNYAIDTTTITLFNATFQDAGIDDFQIAESVCLSVEQAGFPALSFAFGAWDLILPTGSTTGTQVGTMLIQKIIYPDPLLISLPTAMLFFQTSTFQVQTSNYLIDITGTALP
jgi:hypothetical protein